MTAPSLGEPFRLPNTSPFPPALHFTSQRPMVLTLFSASEVPGPGTSFTPQQAGLAISYSSFRIQPRRPPLRGLSLPSPYLAPSTVRCSYSSVMADMASAVSTHFWADEPSAPEPSPMLSTHGPMPQQLRVHAG